MPDEGARVLCDQELKTPDDPSPPKNHRRELAVLLQMVLAIDLRRVSDQMLEWT